MFTQPKEGNMDIKTNIIRLMKKMPSLFFGLFLYAIGILVTLYSNLGMNPWGVFHTGISYHTSLTLGQATQVTGFVIILVGYFLGIIPGIASVCNMIFIGVFVDLIDSFGIIGTPNNIFLKLLMLILGVLVIGWASYFYLRVELGAGPRDGLMEGLVKKIDKPVWLIRGSIEVTILVIGYFLGGPVGIGTLITAFTIGISVQTAFKIGKYSPKNAEHETLVYLFNLFKKKEKDELIKIEK